MNSLWGARRRLTLASGRSRRPRALRAAGPAALGAWLGALAVIAHPSQSHAQGGAPTAPAEQLSTDAGEAADRPARLIVDTHPRATIATYRYQREAPGLPIALPPGEHRVRISLSGFKTRTERVRLDSGEARTLIAPLAPKSRRGAVTRALVFPGWGARYIEKPSSGLALLSLTLLSAGGAIYFDQEMRDKVDTYDNALTRYRSAVSSGDAAAAWRAVEEADGEVGDAEKIRGGLVLATLGVHAIGVAQAFIQFPWGGEESRVGLAPRLDRFSHDAVRVSIVSLAAR